MRVGLLGRKVGMTQIYSEKGIVLPVTVLSGYTLTVTPTTPTVAIGSTIQLQGTVKDKNGVNVSGQTINWTAIDPTLATVNSSGLVSGVAAHAVTSSAAGMPAAVMTAV